MFEATKQTNLPMIRSACLQIWYIQSCSNSEEGVNMSQNSGKPWLNPSRRWVIYAVAGGGISLLHYATVPPWYGKILLVPLVTSIVCYFKYELPNHSMLNFVTGVAAGVWTVSLFAWLYGRLTHGTTTFLLVASVTALIGAAYADYKGAKR
jgi:hypothetical protein